MMLGQSLTYKSSLHTDYITASYLQPQLQPVKKQKTRKEAGTCTIEISVARAFK